MTSTASARVPQEERTRVMRARLLDATVECLVERGFAGTSTTLVSERAGVSRGAQLHHFPPKNDLVVAAVVHLAFGSPGGRPTSAQIASSLEELGVHARRSRGPECSRSWTRETTRSIPSTPA